jgi:hypothetical protein
VKNDKKQKKRTKRTQFMCAKMLHWLRKDMRFEPRDMCDTFKQARRTYQDYEAGKRGIPAKLAARIREKHKADREWINGIGDRVDAVKRGEK